MLVKEIDDLLLDLMKRLIQYFLDLLLPNLVLFAERLVMEERDIVRVLEELGTYFMELEEAGLEGREVSERWFGFFHD